MMALSAQGVVEALDLAPHPEGGFFKEIFRAPASPADRGAVTSIYFLLQAGQVSAWHRVDAVEIWCFHAGAPLELSIANAEHVTKETLGTDLAAGERPQAVVPKDAWQSARSLGDWTLVGCQVAPAFDFAGFELAPEGWQP
ncbi:MAG: cupin domain-containing protein [Magnetovibrionaceae bacterium]